jgi:hypothetical protein
MEIKNMSNKELLRYFNYSLKEKDLKSRAFCHSRNS